MDVRGLASGFDPQAPWAAASLAVIDFETTGLDPTVDRVIEMGIVCFDDGVKTASWNALINPTIPVPAEASAVHGITDEMLAEQPAFDAVWPEAQKLLEGRLPVAYNASFDKRFLLAELERIGETTWGSDVPPAMQSDVEWIDPLVWARELFPEHSGKLTAICEHLDIPLEDAHRAANDAEATGRILVAMSDRMPAIYAELIRVQVRYAAQQDVDLAIWRGRRF